MFNNLAFRGSDAKKRRSKQQARHHPARTAPPVDGRRAHDGCLHGRRRPRHVRRNDDSSANNLVIRGIDNRDDNRIDNRAINSTVDDVDDHR
ncbi:MAG: hypothetical protein ACR2QO_10495 [Acidimicrobiales bacterium]